MAISVRHGRNERIRQDLLSDLVLEDGAADSDADGLAEGAEEREEGDAGGDIERVNGGLDAEGHAWEEQP